MTAPIVDTWEVGTLVSITAQLLELADLRSQLTLLYHGTAEESARLFLSNQMERIDDQVGAALSNPKVRWALEERVTSETFRVGSLLDELKK